MPLSGLQGVLTLRTLAARLLAAGAIPGFNFLRSFVSAAVGLHGVKLPLIVAEKERIVIAGNSAFGSLDLAQLLKAAGKNIIVGKGLL